MSTPPATTVAYAAGAERTATPVAVWTDALVRRRPPPFEPSAHHRVVVLAAHPDDETLGAGGCMQILHRCGAAITLVIATDGEAAYPAMNDEQRRALGRIRRTELAAALAVQGLAEVPVRWLGLPDGGLAEHGDVLCEALVPILADADAYLAPWPDDPHPDHQAAGRAAAAAAPATTHGWSYPIWMWAWNTPDDPAVPWPRAHLLELDAEVGRTKRDAIVCFGSQITPGPDGTPPVLAASVLAHAARGAELFFREPRSAGAPVDRFVELYADGNDPWQAGSWYERRKRAVALASLPRERYRAAFEPGCGAGELTSDLAQRCSGILASDPVPMAVERARAATAGVAGIRVECNALPAGVPDDPIDLAVFSEVLYYLDDAALEETLRRTVAVLEPGGDVLVVHWRGWPSEAPRDAVATHAVLRNHPELEALIEHVDEDFLLRAPTPVIAGVGVVVPACDEEDRIVACLRSIRRALRRLPPETARVVTVVLDHCRDRTPERVATMLADWSEAEAVFAQDNLPRARRASNGSGANVGALRDLGLRRALARLASQPADRIWLLSTDADTTVPADWARTHVRLAEAGAHGVAGLAELDDGSHLPAGVVERYGAIVAGGLHGRRHAHVYGANLGFRADAYLAVGGFPPEGPGEDHGLWWRLAAGGYRLEHPSALRVRTSARIRGRAEGGLADLLRSLHM